MISTSILHKQQAAARVNDELEQKIILDSRYNKIEAPTP